MPHEPPAETPPASAEGASKVVTAKRHHDQISTAVLAIVPSVPTTVGEWSELIRTRLAATVQTIIDTGSALIDCKAALEHGQFLEVLAGADVNERVAQMFMAIASHPVLADASAYSYLPPSYNALAQLARLEESELRYALKKGEVTQDLTTFEARDLVRRTLQRIGGRLRDGAIAELVPATDQVVQKIGVPAPRPERPDRADLNLIKSTDEPRTFGEITRLAHPRPGGGDHSGPATVRRAVVMIASTLESAAHDSVHYQEVDPRDLVALVAELERVRPIIGRIINELRRGGA